MNRSNQTLFIILFCVQMWIPSAAYCQITSNPVPAAVISALTASWTNELGSVLTITTIDSQTGAVTGDYRSPSGAGGQSFPLRGWVNTKSPNPDHTNNVTVISFSVRWGAIGSITTWNGYYTVQNGSDVIVGQWLLARPNSDFIWDHIIAGQDRFHK